MRGREEVGGSSMLDHSDQRRRGKPAGHSGISTMGYGGRGVFLKAVENWVDWPATMEVLVFIQSI